MKKLLRHALALSRIVIILLAVVSLTVSGAESAKRLFTGYGNHQSDEKRLEELAWLMPGPPTPEEAHGQMARHSQPNGEQPALVAAPVIVKTDNSENRPDPGTNKPAQVHGLRDHSGHNQSIKTATSHVSASLALQFTLVGAKPSGTS